MSDQATHATDDQATGSPDRRVAYEPSWYASLLAFSENHEAVDDSRAVD
ncbi:MAG: hypothetical protein M3O98_06965 [Actinomycetota bacterium]|jgi:hypothetical protein|nr:hypothetical protein [Actinomycetota bacterium]